MTEIIATFLWLAVGFAVGYLFAKAKTFDDYNAMYSHLTAEIISRMTRAMRSLSMEQEDIDMVIHRMGCKVMPPAVPPPPAPQEKKRVNKCPSWDAVWGCAISPAKRCDGCSNANWVTTEDRKED